VRLLLWRRAAGSRRDLGTGGPVSSSAERMLDQDVQPGKGCDGKGLRREGLRRPARGHWEEC